MGIEHHRQRLARTLRMPEHTALTVGDSSFLGGFDSLANGKILMIACKYLITLQALVGKQDKVFQNVEQAVFCEDTLKERVKLGKLRIFS